MASAENFKETDILPYSQGPITAGRNYVYCATFQIAWEEMQKTIASGPIKLKDDPELAVMLNEHPFDRSNLAADSYLAMGGKIEQGIVPNIRQAMQKKFPDATLAVPDPPIKAGFYVYAYLTKAVEFQEAFDRLEKPILFESKGLTTGVTAFGVEEFKESSPRGRALCKQVSVLDYRSDDDFVVSLNAASDVDQIVLAKTKPEASLQATIDAVEERIKNSKLSKYECEPHMDECLKIPVISLGVERVYHEIKDKKFQNSGLEDFSIAEARQGIRFHFDEFGAKLESWSVEAVKSVQPPKLRHFIINKPFLIYLKEKSKTVPYFAMWIETPELFQKAR